MMGHGLQRRESEARRSSAPLLAAAGRRRSLRCGSTSLGLPVLQCLESAVLLQWDHDGFNLARSADHPMVANVGASVQGIFAHVPKIPATVLFNGLC